MRPTTGLLTFIAVFVASALLLTGCKKAGDIVIPPPGPAWLTFKLPETPQLLDNKINALYADQSGRVWIATDSGANYFHRGSWGKIRDSLRYSNDGVTFHYAVNSIMSGKFSTIWFGLDGGGVKRYREGATRSVWTTYFSEITYPVVQSIAADLVVNGDVWIATTFGVSRFIPSAADPEFGTWFSYLGPAYLPSNQVYASTINFNDNTVWFGTQSGFALYNDMLNDWTSFSFPPAYDYRINSMAFDRAGTLWMATVDGVTSFNKEGGVWNYYTSTNTGGKLPPGEIHAVTTDLGTTRWFGSDHGLVRLSDTTWTTFTTATTPELPSNTITALAYDRMGNLWIGTKQGIAVFNPDGTRF
jgi:ligand-binding sensor domain-containing protein